ncbi:MAG: hypothetical protein ACTSR8_02855 [Promethearchaeota archaeon]
MKHAYVDKNVDLYKTPLEELQELQSIAEKKVSLYIRETTEDGHITRISIDIKDGELIPFFFLY